MTDKRFDELLCIHNNLVAVQAYDEMDRRAQDDPRELLRSVAGKQYGEVMRTFEKGDRGHARTKGMLKRI